MPKVKMLKDKLGSPNGITVHDYVEGVEYDLPASLADVFVGEGAAEFVKGKARGRKAKGAAPENKAG